MQNKDLKSLLGKDYEENDADGKYIGCFEPLYFLYNYLPRYSLDEADSAFEFPYKKLLEDFRELYEGETPNVGDVAVFKLRGDVLHCGVFIDESRIIHVRQGHQHEIHPVRLFRASLYGVLRPKRTCGEGT